MSNDERSAKLVITADATGATAGFEKVKTGAREMAGAVKQEGDKAGQAIRGMGDGADGASKKLDKATSSMIASVQRTTAAMQAGERGTSKFYEALAAQRGVNVATLQPYIDKLKEVEQSQNKLGVSAKQTAAAMRGVPAQFTDIITSLQGGQAPLTVLLQQGGQLKDMFGGAGNAAKALGGYVVGLVNPVTVAAAAVGALGYAYYSGSKEATGYAHALILSGNAAGTTVSQLGDMAKAIARVTSTQGTAAEALAIFAGEAKVTAGNLQEFTQAAIKFEQATGQAVNKTAEQFAALAKDPLTASLKLNDSMNYLTMSAYKQINALEQQGKMTEAAAVAQKAFADAALNMRSDEILQNLGYLEQAWRGLKGEIAGAWNVLKDIGRESTNEEKLTRIRNVIALKQSSLENTKGTYAGDVLEKEIEQLRTQESVLQSTVRELAKGVALRSEEAEKVKARAEADKDGLKYLTDTQRMERDIAQQRETLVRAGASEVEIQKRIALIRSSYAQKTLGGENELAAIKAKIVATGEYIDRLRDLNIENPKLTEAEQLSLKLQKELQGSIRGTARALKEQTLAQAQNLAQIEKQAVATEQWRAMSKEIDEWRRSSTEAAAVYADEARLAGLTGMERAKVVAQRQVELQLAKEISKINRSDMSESDKEDLRQKAREAAKVASAAATAKAVQDEWTKVSDQINQSLTDALLRGFESGKGFAENFRATLENMFKTVVLRPVIAAMIAPVSAAMASGLDAASSAGGSTAGTGSAGGANLLSQASGLNSLYNLMSTGVSNSIQAGFAKLATSSFGQEMGLSTQAAGPVTATGEGSVAMTAEAQSMSSALGMAGSALAGLALSKGLSGGYKTNNSTVVDMATLAASAYFGPLAGLAGAAFNRAFGEKMDDTGILGTFGGKAGFNGTSYTHYDGGYFSSDRTSIRSLDPKVQNALAGQFHALQVSTAMMAQNLGVGTEAIQNFTKDVRISLNGMTGDQAAARLKDEVTAINESLATLALGTDAFNKLGESNADALTRLSSSLMSVNAALKIFGSALLETSIKGADAASQLVDAFGSVDAFTSASNAYYESFYTEAERINMMAKQVSESMGALGLAVPATREQFRALVKAQDLMTESGRATYAALIKLSPAFAQVTAAAESAAAATKVANMEAARSATDAAFAALERAASAAKTTVQAQIDVAQQSVQSLQSIFDMLKSNVEELYASVSVNASQSAAAGRTYIANALSAAQTTGYMPDQAGLTAAIQAVRNGFSTTQYTSAFEAERDKLILAGQLSKLKDLSGEQLSEAEKMLRVAKDQLSGIDAQVQLAKSQIDAIRGVDTSVVSVKDAISQLNAALSSERQASIAAAAPAVTQAVPQSITDMVSSMYTNMLGRAADASGLQYWANQVATGAVASGNLDEAMAVAAAQNNELSSSVVAKLHDMGWGAGTANSWAAAHQLPTFAQGGSYQGGLALVGEAGPELINFANPGQVYTADQTQNILGGNADQAAELRALRAEMAAQNRAIVETQMRLARLMERWDGEGMPETRSVTL